MDSIVFLLFRVIYDFIFSTGKSPIPKRAGEKDSTSFSPALLKYFFISGHGRRFHERQRPAVSFSRRI